MSKPKGKPISFELAPKIEEVIILDNNGNRLSAKYYSNKEEFRSKDTQTKFDNAILSKANDVLLFTDHLVLYIIIKCTYIYSGIIINK